ncbi:SUN2 protein, partial [Glaucidium brasilianum]|nr:SUN2 protein [Glaucidium brasilianum]
IAISFCFQPDISPGYCWPVQASRSQVVIRLPTQVRPAAITVQHPLKTSELIDISSAPRDFTVFGVGEEEKETMLGEFSYDIEGKPTQTFHLQVRELYVGKRPGQT